MICHNAKTLTSKNRMDCIINGCKNNDKNKEDGPNRNILFHVFPLNPVLKARWLKAIGRSDWEPPDYARICSDHFKSYQINSNFEESIVKICRICLAADDDLTLYSLQYGKLKQYMETILPINNDSCLPQFACFECAVHLRKCYNMIKKSEKSRGYLLEIFAQNGEITESLVKKLNRENLELKSPLEPHSVTPTYIFNYQFNYEQNLSCLTDIEYVYDLNENKTELITKSEPVSVKTDHNDDKDVNENLEIETNSVIKPVNDHISCDDHEADVENGNESNVFSIDDENNSACLSEESTDVVVISADGKNENEKKDANCVIKSISDASCDDDESDFDIDKELNVIYIDDEYNRASLSEESADEIPISVKENALKRLKKRLQKKNDKSKTKTTRSRKQSTKKEKKETIMSKHYNVVNLLTLQEKIDEWNKAMENPHWIKNKGDTNSVFKCEACLKLFANRKTYEQHSAYHDPSYGIAECPVCKIRHKSEKLLRKHMKSHGKKYCCKYCPNSFFTRASASKHYWRHTGRVYNCGRCSYTTGNRSMLSVHVQRTHSHAFACELCGRACVNRAGLQRHYDLQHPGEPLAPEGGEVFPCEECKLNFNSKNALRVHSLTAVQHKNGNRENSSPQPARKLCEYCDALLHNGFEYSWHLRKQHPEHENKTSVAAICAICGKGYPNEIQLRNHELRHSNPRERCEQCDRMFYDKSTLARHYRIIHRREQLYSCDVCARSFSFKGNLKRHMRVHTGEKPYECSICGKKFTEIGSRKLHVRTVHLKMPHPPRKKRKPKPRPGKNKPIDSDTINNINT